MTPIFKPKCKLQNVIFESSNLNCNISLYFLKNLSYYQIFLPFQKFDFKNLYKKIDFLYKLNFPINLHEK